jgi:hypothetical protein
MHDKTVYQAYTERDLLTTPLHTIALIIQAVQTQDRIHPVAGSARARAIPFRSGGAPL